MASSQLKVSFDSAAPKLSSSEASAVALILAAEVEFLLPTGIPNIVIYTKFKKRVKNAFSVDKGIEGFSMSKIPFVDSTKICEINADNFKDEDTLLDEIVFSLDKLLNNRSDL